MPGLRQLARAWPAGALALRLSAACALVTGGATTTVARAQSPAPDEQVIRLRVGQVYELDASDVASYSSSGPFELEYRAEPPRLVARFEHPGTFSVLVIYEGGRQRRVIFAVE